MPISLLPLLLALVAPSRATHLEWTITCPPEHVARIEVRTLDDQLISRFLSADRSDRKMAGWRPDTEPARGVVSGEAELFLPVGIYTIRELGPSATTERTLLVTAPGEADASRVMALEVGLLPGATGAIAWRRTDEGGHDAVAWTPALPEGVGEFFLSTEGTWFIEEQGVAAAPFRCPSCSSRMDFTHPHPARSRVSTPTFMELWSFRLFLLPVTVLFLGLIGWGAWRARQTRGLSLAILVALTLAVITLLPVLSDLGGSLLAQPGNSDPTDSVAQLAATADALTRLSTTSAVFQYPEGASWLVTGPNWLGYLLPTLLSWFFGPVVGFNLGIAAGVALLVLASWGLARSLGAGPITSLMAGGASALAPAFWAELGVVSLDRTTLFLVPLFFLCLHQTSRVPEVGGKGDVDGMSGWGSPVATGVALAAVFYGQVYYGLYLAAAAPLLFLPRLFGHRPLLRLARLGVAGGIALALVFPGLLILKSGTAGTPYHEGSERLIHSGRDLLRPLSEEEVARFAQTQARSGDAQASMDTPADRLLAAMARSQTWKTFRTPTEQLPGRIAWWWLALAALPFARRRGTALLAFYDVAVLMVYSLGPFLVTGSGVHLSPPLPYYLNFLLIPGFEQLKQVNRYFLLAATISTVPLALGLHGMIDRVIERLRSETEPHRLKRVAVRFAGFILVGLLTASLVVLRIQNVDPDAPSAPAEAVPPKRTLTSERVYSDRVYEKKVVFKFSPLPLDPYPLPEALQDLPRGPALGLPYIQPSPASMAMAAVMGGFALMNGFPYGQNRGHAAQADWSEGNAFINVVTRAAGSDRPGLMRTMADPQGDIHELRGAGLRYLILWRDALPGPELATDVEEILDAHLRRIADDGNVAVWGLESP